SSPLLHLFFLLFFFHVTPPTDISTPSLHDALPICAPGHRFIEAELIVKVLKEQAFVVARRFRDGIDPRPIEPVFREDLFRCIEEDRKSTRLNSSHVAISYAVFCLKKKNQISYLYEH